MQIGVLVVYVGLKRHWPGDAWRSRAERCVGTRRRGSVSPARRDFDWPGDALAMGVADGVHVRRDIGVLAGVVDGPVIRWALNDLVPLLLLLSPPMRAYVAGRKY